VRWKTREVTGFLSPIYSLSSIGSHLSSPSYQDLTFMSFSPLIDHLVESFRCLPGVGPKSAQRMALHILERNREGGLKLSAALQSAVEEVRNCQQCRTLCETEVCRLCGNPQRDRQQICIVETPTDVLAVEQSGTYSGLYFVLMGHLSPIDGIGPAELGIDLLVRRVRDPLHC